ncbi:hypothetical protein D3C80_1653290 [compost metagenome]
MKLGKGLEQQPLAGRGNADSGIFYSKFENNRTVLPDRFQLRSHADRSFISELNGIADQIDKNLTQSPLIGYQERRELRVNLRLEHKPFFLYPRIKDFGYVRHHLP